MSDNVEERIKALEEALERADRNIANMPAEDADLEDSNEGTGICFPIVYALGAIIPLIGAAILYFMKPKQITKKSKGKYVLDTQKYLMWVGAIALVSWAILFGINYMGGFDRLQQFCFGK